MVMIFDLESVYMDMQQGLSVRFSLTTDKSVVQVDHLVGVEDVQRVECALDGAHRVERARAVLLLQVSLLPDAHTVLAGACAAARDRALKQPMVHAVQPLGVLGRVVRVRLRRRGVASMSTRGGRGVRG